MEAQIEAAVAAHDLPGVVLLATSKDGKFTYSKTFGHLSLKDGDEANPISIHSPMWVASCTKLLTTIAALQCIEKGLLDLESDVTKIIPELADVKILTGFDANEQPTFVERKKPIKLHQLLTHSAGLSYEMFNVELMKWRKSQGTPPPSRGTTTLTCYLCPLIYEPGSGWDYSSAIDFVGLMVARVTKMPLQEYMEKHIWEPIGMKDATFFLADRPDLKADMPRMSYRDSESGKAVWKDVPPAPPATEAMGGGGLYTRPSEYLKVLHAILKNDGTLLAPDTVADMFQPHLGPESERAFAKLLATPEYNAMLGSLPATKRNWGWGGLLHMEDLQDWRRKGTLIWGGMPNLTWWIDREAELCGLYASQILPPADPKSLQMSILFEKAMYERYAQEKARL